MLNRDVHVPNGDAITIRASHVTLDLNGRTVSTASPSIAPFQSRGIFVDGEAAMRRGIAIKNGKVSGFSVNLAVMNAQNLVVSDLQIVGMGAAPSGGPTEIGIMLINTRGSKVKGNVITSVNLGLFVRGTCSSGNRIMDNTLTGSETAGNNLLGICYNPAPGEGEADGPRGDLIYNNHIARYGFAIAISSGSRYNIFRDNTLASHNGPFREPSALTENGGTNVSEGNTAVMVPPAP